MLEVEAPVFSDNRGFFTEIHSQRNWAACGFKEEFRQDNLSKSRKGTLRGLHYQLEPHGMGKFIRVLSGAVYDVAVDLREGSPTFGKSIGRTLSAENGLGLWIPAGLAHGFLALEDDTLAFYKCSNVWMPESERTLFYNDPAVGIAWPSEPTTITEKDAKAPLLKDVDRNFTYQP